jgi:hypothetical protein
MAAARGKGRTRGRPQAHERLRRAVAETNATNGAARRAGRKGRNACRHARNRIPGAAAPP